MANPQRPAPGANRTTNTTTSTASTKRSSTGLYIGIIAVIILLLVLFFGGFFTADPVAEEEIVTPLATEEEELDIVPEPVTPEVGTDPVETIPETDADLAPVDPAVEEEDVIDIEGDADVEVLDES
jgi:hypothetical protein